MRRPIWVIFLMLGCVLADQTTKLAAEALLPRASEVVMLGGAVKLINARNRGAFLSIGASLSSPVRYWTLTVSVSLLLAGLCIYLLWSRELGALATVALSLMLGGGLSNLTDRMLHDGAVVDCMVLSLGPLHTGIFNLADVMIMAGALSLLAAGLRRERGRRGRRWWPWDMAGWGAVWLQGAEAYERVHRLAVETLPPGQGKRWLDVGCGAGLVARLAASRGYRARGMDPAPAIVAAARRLARQQGSAASFTVGALESVAPNSADVVSAASLLAVLDDKEAALCRLWQAVRPGGHLLIVEPTERMSSAHMGRLIAAGEGGRRSLALRAWAAARAGRATDPAVYTALGVNPRKLQLLAGMVGVWLFEKGAA